MGKFRSVVHLEDGWSIDGSADRFTPKDLASIFTGIVMKVPEPGTPYDRPTLQSNRGNVAILSAEFEKGGAGHYMCFPLRCPPDTIYLLNRIPREGHQVEEELFAERRTALLTPSEAQRILKEIGSKKRLGEANVMFIAAASPDGTLESTIDRVSWLTNDELLAAFAELPEVDDWGRVKASSSHITK